jgi:RimJ/RimL family protein N-acetyltransferase
MAIAKQCGSTLNGDTCGIIARVRDDVLLGGIVYYNCTGESVAIHVGAWEDRWINRDMLWAAMDYPFNVLEVKRLFCEIKEENEHAMRFSDNFGFRTVARIEGVYLGYGASIVRRLDREDCRFLNVKPRNIGRVTH